ncbi:MAG: hypothetical protein M1830_000046 [Pleopsidium flavum]|nr:MAG: hypothetical protein M1830_000046 [Pleopsidium flavum]
MEELQAKHRKEQRDLQSKVTQKKKSATKKTRKGVNDECAELESNLRKSQQGEIAALSVGPLSGTLDDSDNDQHKVRPSLLKETSQARNGFKTEESCPPPQGTLVNHEANNTRSALGELSIADEADQSKQPKKQNRQKARLAKRAAEQEALAAKATEEAADLPDLREAERSTMLKEFESHGLKEKEIRPDGHCLYSAVADQLKLIGVDLRPQLVPKISDIETNGNPGEGDDYRIVRCTVAEFISQHPDDFSPFLEEPLDEYTHKIRNTAEWGGQIELLALAKAYGVEIYVIQGASRLEKIVPSTDTEGKTICLAYYRYNFGLGEHYNSLRKAP